MITEQLLLNHSGGATQEKIPKILELTTVIFHLNGVLPKNCNFVL